MMPTFSDGPPLPVPPRPEADVLEELHEANARAKRMPIVGRNYGPTHSLINELLDELEETRRVA